MSGECFLDSNVLLYLISDDPDKARIAEDLVAAQGTISVQVLNEFASVARRKYNVSWPIVRQALLAFKSNLAVVPMTIDVHDRGLDVAERFRLSVYDAMLTSAALGANCRILYSEDMHNGLVVDGLTIRNPFRTN